MVDTGNRKYARSGTSTTEIRWTTNQSNELNWDNRETYSFYSGNYINWYNTEEEDLPVGGEVIKTRMEIVKEVATGLISDLDGVNLGIMRYANTGGCPRDSDDDDWEARGGMVMYPISPLTDASRAAMIAEIDSWEPAGWTPLSETLYEAHQYLSGGAVVHGNTSSVQAADYDNDCTRERQWRLRRSHRDLPVPECSVVASRRHCRLQYL